MKNILITPSFTSYNITKLANRKYLDARLEELKRLRLKEISLFVTTLNAKEREYVNKRLLETAVISIPHVHLRNDMNEREAVYYYENYGTRRFTIHHQFRRNFIKWNLELRRCIGLENNEDMTSLADTERFGGLAIDLSHYVMHPVHKPRLAPLFDRALERFPVIVNHASGVFYKTKIDTHWIFNKTNFDYLKDVPKKCFSDVISLEVGNTFASQLEYIRYIKKLLKL